MGGRSLSTFLQLFLRSFETGAIYALATLGIIIVFRTNFVINFAQGVMGMFGAYIVTVIFVKTGMPLLLAILLGVIAAIAIGFIVDFVIIRNEKGRRKRKRDYHSGHDDGVFGNCTNGLRC